MAKPEIKVEIKETLFFRIAKVSKYLLWLIIKVKLPVMKMKTSGKTSFIYLKF